MESRDKTEAYYNDREVKETLSGIYLDAKAALDEFNKIVRKWNETHEQKIHEQLIVPRTQTTM